MDSALGAGYSRSWAHDFVLAELGGLTAEQALAKGYGAKEVWRAVHRQLQLPPSAR